MPGEAGKCSTSTQEHFSHVFSQPASVFDLIKISAFSMVNSKSGRKEFYLSPTRCMGKCCLLLVLKPLASISVWQTQPLLCKRVTTALYSLSYSAQTSLDLIFLGLKNPHSFNCFSYLNQFKSFIMPAYHG